MTLSPAPALAPQASDPALRSTCRGDRYLVPTWATRSPVIARQGMAATSHPLATQVAVDVLRAGGSAVDAAIAANAALGFLEPTGAGLGGDLFALLWSAADQRLHGLNASGRSPAGLTLEQLQQELRGAEEIPLPGPLSVTVPGAVDGWWELHARFGRLPWAELLAPAIRYAREGAPVPSYIAALWARGAALADQPGFAETFFRSGQAPRTGEIFRNPALAETLQQLAEGGRDTFYRGEIARELDAFCRRAGCHLRYEDLAAHRSEWVEPIGVDFHRHRVWQLPPNGQGLAVLQMLRLLEPFDLRSLGHNSAAYLRHLIEAKKIVYE
ncbi:MAG: gamma-glutamyltransferase, partial [Gemmatimonadetes bacterium]|nr:gamma-glutamyltransferase [Gemmatimonadota bacterium]